MSVGCRAGRQQSMPASGSTWQRGGMLRALKSPGVQVSARGNKRVVKVWSDKTGPPGRHPAVRASDMHRRAAVRSIMRAEVKVCARLGQAVSGPQAGGPTARGDAGVENGGQMDGWACRPRTGQRGIDKCRGEGQQALGMVNGRRDGQVGSRRNGNAVYMQRKKPHKGRVGRTEGEEMRTVAPRKGIIRHENQRKTPSKKQEPVGLWGVGRSTAKASLMPDWRAKGTRWPKKEGLGGRATKRSCLRKRKAGLCEINHERPREPRRQWRRRRVR